MSMNRFEFNTGDHKEEEEKVLVGRSYGKEVLYRFRKNKGAWISFFIIILLIVIALAAPAVSSYSYKEVHSEYSNLPPRIPGLEKLGIFDGDFLFYHGFPSVFSLRIALIYDPKRPFRRF